MRNPELDAQVDAVLRRAAELVETGWCQFAMARDVGGANLGSALSPTAVSWCAAGAVYRAACDAAGASDSALYDACMLRLGKTLRLDRVRIALYWNDHPKRTQQEVVDALLRAGRVK